MLFVWMCIGFLSEVYFGIVTVLHYLYTSPDYLNNANLILLLYPLSSHKLPKDANKINIRFVQTVTNLEPTATAALKPLLMKM